MRQVINVELLTLHLFSGAGGGILADALLGFRPIGAVEIDAYCRRVLLDRQADGCLHRFPIWDDVCTFRADNPATRDYIDRLRAERNRLCICGGFPCQDISAAGKGAGITGARSGLWKEYARIVSEIRPAYVFMENSPLLVRRGLDVVLADLSTMGYSVTWGVISAASVGALHIRQRWWGLAVRDSADASGRRCRSAAKHGKAKQTTLPTDNLCQYIPDAKSSRRKAGCNSCNPGAQQLRPDQLLQRIPDALYRWNERRIQTAKDNKRLETPDRGGEKADTNGQKLQIEPRLGGVVNGLANWLDEVTTGRFWDAQEHGLPRLAEQCDNRRQRLRAIGNGQVPLCAAVAFVTLLKQYITFCDNGQ